VSVKLSPDVLAAIRAHGESDYPDEACGVLLGRGCLVAEALALPNSKEEERGRRFVIRPSDYIAADREARRRGLDILGFYHSHPDHPAKPSEFDREHAWPNMHYIVLAVAGGRALEATSWMLSEDRSRFESEGLTPIATGE
jgi:proteasome lid subunit RPN8/RPN11